MDIFHENDGKDLLLLRVADREVLQPLGNCRRFHRELNVSRYVDACDSIQFVQQTDVDLTDLVTTAMDSDIFLCPTVSFDFRQAC